MKRNLVVLVSAVALFVAWFLFRPAPENDPVIVRPGTVPAGGSEQGAVIDPSNAPRPRAPERPAGKDVPAQAPAPEPAESQFPFLEKLTPETRASVLRADCAGAIDALLKDLQHTPNAESLDQIVAVMVRLETRLREQLAVIERERAWDLNDPQQRLERSRREHELRSTLREERYESLQQLLPPAALDRLLEAGRDPEEDREP